MNTTIERAAIAAIVAVGLVAADRCAAQEAATVPDGTGAHKELRWTHSMPEMVDNTLVTVQVIGPAAVQAGWLAAGKTIPSGGIVMGYSEVFKYNLHLPGRPDFQCNVKLSFHPKIDPETFEHEMRHCAGWTHPEWSTANVGAE